MINGMQGPPPDFRFSLYSMVYVFNIGVEEKGYIENGIYDELIEMTPM